MPKPILFLLCQLEIGFEDGEASLGIATDEPVFPLAHLLAPPTNDGSVIYAHCRVWDDDLLIDADDLAKALTLRARTNGRVEGKELVGGFLEGDAVGLKAGAEGISFVPLKGSFGVWNEL